MGNSHLKRLRQYVALFTRAWIEIKNKKQRNRSDNASPSLRGRGLKYNLGFEMSFLLPVALFTRAWIEINKKGQQRLYNIRRPLYEGVD